MTLAGLMASEINTLELNTSTCLLTSPAKKPVLSGQPRHTTSLPFTSFAIYTDLPPATNALTARDTRTPHTCSETAHAPFYPTSNTLNSMHTVPNPLLSRSGSPSPKGQTWWHGRGLSRPISPMSYQMPKTVIVFFFFFLFCTALNLGTLIFNKVFSSSSPPRYKHFV